MSAAEVSGFLRQGTERTEDAGNTEGIEKMEETEATGEKSAADH